MSPDDLRTARELCRLVQSTSLFEYLGVSAQAPEADVLEALAKQRRRLQSMQHNPKYKEAASFLLRNHRRVEEVLRHPEAHLADMRAQHEEAHVPMLRLALESVMADGRISAAEQAFLQDTCDRLGISRVRFQQELGELAAARGVVVDLGEEPDNPQDTGAWISPEAARAARLRGADGHGWWDAAFTRLLLECVPGGPSEMVDVYCRTGLSAATVLPERPQLGWTGVDRSPERLERARAALEAQSASARVTLLEGQPSALPVSDTAFDVALAVRALANLEETGAVFAEAWRVLRPGGRFVVAEPDGLAETFYFDGPLRGFTRAFQALAREVDRRIGTTSDPLVRSGLAVGPTLRSRLLEAGFIAQTVRVHASNNLAQLPFGLLCRRLRRYPAALAERGGLLESELLAAVLSEVDALERQIHEDALGVGGHVLPLFLAVGEKPDA